jgi:hypothetical protein
MKTLILYYTNFGYFTGSCIIIPLTPIPTANKTGGNSKGIVSLNSAFEESQQSIICLLRKKIPKHASKLSPAHGTIYRIPGGFLYAVTVTRYLKRVTERIFTISTVVFIKTSQTLSFIFSITRQQKNF